MIEGRDFTDLDDAVRQLVAIVDDALAQRTWPGQDPLGKKLHVSDSPAGPYQFQDDWVVVVGVARHVQYHSLTVMVRPEIYLPYQLASRPVSFVVRAPAPVPSLIGPIRQEVPKLDKNVAIPPVIPLSDLVPLLSTLLFGVRPIDAPTFVAAAVLLSLVGFFACYIPARRAMKVDPMPLRDELRHCSRVTRNPEVNGTR